MATVLPWRAWRYDLARVGEASLVLAPPYDVISESERQAFIDRDPHNIVRLILGVDPLDAPPSRSRYELAAADLREWRREGVLIQEPRPVFYVYEQEYLPPLVGRDQADTTIRRRSLIGLVKLAEYDQREILPHEGTLGAPKADRLRLTQATECSFSQVFGIYSDPDRTMEQATDALCAQPPLFEIRDKDGVTHRMWVLDDEALMGQVSGMFAERPIVIADGHHRYETALAMRAHMRERFGDQGPWEYTSMVLCNVEAGGLTILPSHRLVKELPLPAEAQLWRNVMEVFDTERLAIDSSSDEARARGIHSLLQQMADTPPEEHTFALYAGGNYALLLHLRDMNRALAHGVDELPESVRELDVALLHKLLIEGIMGLSGDMAATGVNVLFSRDGHDAANRVARGEAAMVLYVNTTRVQQVMSVALSGQRMPQKGTYFYPKPLAGLALHDLRPDVPFLTA